MAGRLGLAGGDLLLLVNGTDHLLLVDDDTPTLTAGQIVIVGGYVVASAADLVVMGAGELTVVGGFVTVTESGVQFSAPMRFGALQTTPGHVESPVPVAPFVPEVNPLPIASATRRVPLPPWVPDGGPYRES